MAKPPKRIHRPPPVDGMAACIVLQKGKWQRMQVACHPVDAESVSQLLSGCGPKCVTDFVKNGPKKIQKKKKKSRDTDSLDGDDDFFDIGPIFSAPAVTAAPAPERVPTASEVMADVAVKAATAGGYQGAGTGLPSIMDFTIPIPSWLGRSFKVKSKIPVAINKQATINRMFKRVVDKKLKETRGALQPNYQKELQALYDKLVDQYGRDKPVINVAPSNPAAASNPTGTVSGLSSRRPTMARRKKACSVLRKQGKKLPARCKGTRRKSRR